jgi:ATP-dependent protease ClpP protease subunit
VNPRDRLTRITARGPRDWYRIENAAKPTEADVWIYDEIGFWGTTADQFAREVAGLDVSTINLHLNTPGGSVFDGVAIHNVLRNHKAAVHVTVDGIAASIGSVIAMAGDSVTMGRGTEMMIHNPSGLVMGNAADMREMADLLDRLAVDIADFYVGKAGGNREFWLERMSAETWYAAQEAVDAGLADSVLGSEPPADTAGASWDLSAYGFRHAGRDRAPSPAASAQTNRSVAHFRDRLDAHLEVCGK